MTKKKEHIEYHPFRRTTLKNLKEFNEHEARGWTIDRLQQIEYRIDEKIIDFFKPEKVELFKKILLNSVVLDIGSKLKILSNINSVDTKTIEKIRRLSSIRNGFAHALISESLTINIETNENDKQETVNVKEHSIIKVMNSQGKLVSKNAMEYLTEFLELNNEIRNEI